VGEELEREGMSSSRNRDRVEFTLLVDMWTGIRTEWGKFERGRARRMFTAFKALHCSRYVDFWFHSFCLVRCTDSYRLRSMLLTPVATTFQCYSRLDEQRESDARNWGGTRPRVDDVESLYTIHIVRALRLCLHLCSTALASSPSPRHPSPL